MDRDPGRWRRSPQGWVGLNRLYRAVTGLIVPWGFEGYAHLPPGPFIDDPHLSLPAPRVVFRRETYGSMAPPQSANRCPFTSPSFLDRIDYTSPGRRPRPIHGNVTFPASTRRRSKTCRDPFAASSMTAQSRCSSP